jgi:hypothetical protein
MFSVHCPLYGLKVMKVMDESWVLAHDSRQAAGLQLGGLKFTIELLFRHINNHHGSTTDCRMAEARRELQAS